MNVVHLERLTAAGHGGKILLSTVAQQLVRHHLPPGATVRDWRERRPRRVERKGAAMPMATSSIWVKPDGPVRYHTTVISYRAMCASPVTIGMRSS